MPKNKKKPLRFKLSSIIDEKGRLFGKFDIFVPLFLIILTTLAIFVGRVLLQKDQYITVELFASGGEWFWNNPDPPYWLIDPLQPGSKEYDPQGNVLVEVLDVRKFENADRKMLWMKARLKVSRTNRSDQFQFRREPLQVGSLVFVAPNNIKIFCNVMWIEGMEELRQESERIVTLVDTDVNQFTAEFVQVGDIMKDDGGNVLAEIIDKEIEFAKMVTSDQYGKTHVERNPLRRDITMKVRIKTTKSKDREYFSYFQPVKVNFYLWIPFQTHNSGGTVVNIE